MDVRVGLWRKLSAEELMVLNCGVGEHSWASLGQQGDPTSLTKENQSWIFIGRTDVEVETPILWPPDAKSWLIGKDPDAGKDWRQEEKGTTEDEMVRWYHRLNIHRFGWIPGVGDRQGGLVCCGSQGSKESGMTERLNWTESSWGNWKGSQIGEWEEGWKIRSLLIWDFWGAAGHSTWEAERSTGWSILTHSCHRCRNGVHREDMTGPGLHVCLVAKLG